MRDARESGWLRPDASVVDVGCGIGSTDAWLAGLGHRVVGLDVSSVAVRRARRLHGDVPGLTFERADMTRPIAPTQPFDVLLDLGCLHQLPRPIPEAYVANVRTLTAPGSRLLYLIRIWGPERDESPDTRAAFVQRILGPDFELESAERTEMQASHTDEIRPGVALRFLRR